MESIKEIFGNHIAQLQQSICDAISSADGKGIFIEDRWERPGGGGGVTRIIGNGAVFEKGGVNTSRVEGEVTNIMREQLHISGHYFFATGLSLVLHPVNPFVPTVHANFRYFELYDDEKKIIDQWFGGGLDLTPYYLFNEDASHFHRVLKATCDRFGKGIYPQFKKKCDNYFVNWHRQQERRGIGGIFYDMLRPADEWLEFSCAIGLQFLPAYLPLVERRKHTAYESEHKHWQEIRRGRYAEFNLLHDRGTLFGLKTNGRTESILMSLPPTVRFEYDDEPAPGTAEERLLRVCREPVDWV